MDGSDAERRRPPVEGRSANHFEVAFTEFEFLLDFGQAYDSDRGDLVHTRIILTPASAKTLSGMMAQLIEKYEAEIAPIPERTV